MATSRDSTILEDELTCPVCLDLYQDPHLLPCGHNFCLPCLHRLKSLSERRRIQCPECRQSHRSSAHWQKNLKLANIADGFRRQNQHLDRHPTDPALRSAEVRCDYCPAEGGVDRKWAVKTCLKCEVSMCSKHVQPHLELPAFREHLLVEPLSDLRKRKCVEHDEMFRYYCTDEQVFLCNACSIEGTHAGHTIKTLKNVMKDYKDYIDLQMPKVNKKLSQVEKISQEQKDMEQQSKDFLDDARRHLDSFRQSSLAHLDTFVSSFSESVSSCSAERNAAVRNNLDAIDRDHNRLQEVQSGFETLLKETDPFQFIRNFNESLKRFRRLLKKPLFFPEELPIDSNRLYEVMDERTSEFLHEQRVQTNTLIQNIGQYDDYEDVEEEEGESSDEEEEEEEIESDVSEVEDEMRSVEEDLFDFSDEDYVPEIGETEYEDEL